MTADQLDLDLFPAPTWETCGHDLCHDTHAVVPVGLFCMNCNTLLLQYLPESPEVLGYVSADWAWHNEQGKPWTTWEDQDALAMWNRNPRAWREVAA
jgi:hypothetical protein